MYNLKDCSLKKLLQASVAEGVRIELTSSLLESEVLAFERTLNIVFVCPKRQASFRFVLKGGDMGTIGRGDRTRTGTVARPRDFKSLVATYYTTPP